MEKRLIDRFTEDYDRNLSLNLSREETFKRAKDDFESVCGFTAYANSSSYRAAKYQDRKKRRR